MSTLSTIRGEVRRLLADLNQRAYASATGDGTTTAFPLPDQNIIGKTTVMAATALAATTQTVTTNLVNPPTYSVVYVQGNASGITGNVTVTGTDWQGDAATSTIALSGTTAVAGTQKFKEIWSVALPVYTNDVTDTVKVYAAHSVACTIDSVASTAWTMDFDSGWVDFTSAPSSGSVLLWSYQYTLYNNADVLSAINNALVDLWAEFPKTSYSTTQITPAASTYEYALPTDCARLIRVESKASSTKPYDNYHNWRVIENGATKYLKFYEEPSTTETIRIHYIAEPTLFGEDTDTLSGSGVPERAKWALIYMACFYLCEQKLLPRARTNQFKNAEGVNVPKIYEVQRIAADFRTLAELEMRKIRLGPKKWS